MAMALIAASVPLPVNLVLDTDLASKELHTPDQNLNHPLKYYPLSTLPSIPPSPLLKHLPTAGAQAIYSAAHPTKPLPFRAPAAFHEQEARVLNLWGFTWSAIILILLGISYSCMDWEVRQGKRGLGIGMWPTFGPCGWPKKMDCRRTGFSPTGTTPILRALEPTSTSSILPKTFCFKCWSSLMGLERTTCQLAGSPLCLLHILWEVW